MSDVLDELIARAWNRFAQRPQNQSLDVWLAGLVHEVIDELIPPPTDQVPIDAPLSAEQERAEEPLSTANFPFWREQASITLEELLPDPSPTSNPEAVLEAEELEELVLNSLRDIPPVERRAFALAAFDGWTEEEIAMLLGRTPARVRKYIAAVRALVRQRLAPDAELGAHAAADAAKARATSPATDVATPS